MGVGYWMNETSGMLRPAIEAYLNGAEMTPEQIAAMRAYLRQWINGAPWGGEIVPTLRNMINGLTTRTAIKKWLDIALYEADIDPL